MQNDQELTRLIKRQLAATQRLMLVLDMHEFKASEVTATEDLLVAAEKLSGVTEELSKAVRLVGVVNG